MKTYSRSWLQRVGLSVTPEQRATPAKPFGSTFYTESGAVRSVRRSAILGPVAEIRTLREARLRLDKHLGSANAGAVRPDSRLRFVEFINNRWIPDVLPAYKLSSRNQYKYFLKTYLLPFCGDYRLEEIRPEQVQRLITSHSKLAPKTLRSMGTVLSATMRSALQWKFIESNPVVGIKFPPKRSIRIRRALTPEAFVKLLANVREPARTIAVLIVTTGMRIGEVLALRWGRIDFAARTLSVEEGVYENEFSTPKTECGIRVLPLSDFVVQTLSAWAKDREHSDNDLVFPNELGTVNSRRNLANRQLLPAAAAAGIGRIGWHDLRRTHSTWLKDVGASPSSIQAQLGHSDPRLAFELYVLSVPGERRAAVERVSEELERCWTQLDPIGPKSTAGEDLAQIQCASESVN